MILRGFFVVGKSIRMEKRKRILCKNILIDRFCIIEENLTFELICWLLAQMVLCVRFGIKKDTLELVVESLT